jgi:ABC-type amino acid transport substrate-binding protein
VALKDKGFALDALSDLRGKRIGARQGYRYPLLDGKQGMTLMRYSTDGEMLRSLLFGETDVIVLSAVSDIFALRSEGIMKRLVILNKSVGTVPLVAAFSKKQFTRAETDAFNKALAEFRQGPQWKAILERNGLSDLVQAWPMITQ